MPELAAVYRGAAEVRQVWREWLAAWETITFEYELIDADDRVLALIDQRMRGRSTGIEVSAAVALGRSTRAVWKRFRR